MSHRVLTALGPLVLLLGLSSGACSRDSGGQQADAHTSTPPKAAPAAVSADRVTNFKSLGEMTAESQLVARIVATGDVREVTSEAAGRFVSAITKATVLEVFKGDASLQGSNIEVRQSKQTSTYAEDEFVPVLQAGKTYVLFAKSDVIPEEGPQTQYWPARGSGLFSLSSTGKLVHLDPESDLTQRTLSLDQLRQLVH